MTKFLTLTTVSISMHFLSDVERGAFECDTNSEGDI